MKTPSDWVSIRKVLQKFVRKWRAQSSEGEIEELACWRFEADVSDRFGAQMGWAKTDNQVCLPISSATPNAIDAGDAVFASGLLKRACAIDRPRATFADATLSTYNYQLDAPPLD